MLPAPQVDPDTQGTWDAAKPQTVMFVDIVESVRLMDEHEQATLQRLRILFSRLATEVATPLSASGTGRMVKSIGDGVMLIFDRVRDSVQAAFRTQCLSGQMNAGVPPEEQLLLRVSCHATDVVDAGFDVFGRGVNLAQRLATLAGPGEIVVSAEVRDQIVDGIDADLEDLGECFLKHLSSPVRAYRLLPAGHRPPARTSIAAKPQPKDIRPSIAVVPLTCINARGGLADSQVLGDILADDTIACLSRNPEFRVISRLSTQCLRDLDPRHWDIALRQLNADYVLSGRCTLVGESVTLNGSLTETQTQSMLHTVTGKARVTDILAGTNAAAIAAAELICKEVLQREAMLASGSALPTLASHTILLGSISLLHRNSARALTQASDRLYFLIDRHQRHPLPYAWLAKCRIIEAAQGWTKDRNRTAQEALDAARRALDADSDCSFALALKGQVHAYLLKEMDKAISDYEEAIRLNPNESLAWIYKATWHAWNDQGEAAVAAARHALRLSPLDPLKYYFDSLASTAHLVAGHYQEAIELAQRSLRANVTHTSTYRMLAIAQVETDDLDAARSTMKTLLELEPNLTVSRFLARYPGSNSKHARSFARSLERAGLPIN